VKLLITIDTEEDNWAHYRTTDNPVENIECIEKLQTLFDRYGVKPTYLVSYPVATNPRSVSILNSIRKDGRCEIGSHCHPWNTPPFDEDINVYNSMLCNLPEDLQYEKLKSLHEVICENFGVSPVSFRAGRWGFDSKVARSLVRLGYRVESSVTPYCGWAAYTGPDFSAYDPQPFKFTPDSLSPQATGSLLQIPASIGYLQQNFQRCQRLSQLLDAGLCKSFHLMGVLRRLRMLNKVWLSPESADADTMIKLAKRLRKEKYPCLNMTFHSTSLLAGLSPFVATEQEGMRFLQNIELFLKYVSSAGYESMTLAQYESCS